MKLKLSDILKMVAGVFAIIAVVALFLPGLYASQEVFGEKASSSVSFFGLAFSGGPLTLKGNGSTISQKYSGGLSVFALLAVVLLVVAIVLVVLAIVLKKRNLVWIAALLLVVAGISALLVKVVGTPFSMEGVTGNIPFKDFVGEFKLGIGSILFAVGSIVSAALLAGSNFVENKK